MGGIKNQKNLLEYIKVVSFVIMAVSLSIINWNLFTEVSSLKEIEGNLRSIIIAINNLQH